MFCKKHIKNLCLMKQAKFSIQGLSGGLPFTISVEKFFYKTAAKKVVLLGTVTEGSVTEGDMLRFTMKGKDDITDTVMGMQINKKSISTAKQSQNVGICLNTLTMDTLVEFNRPMATA